MRKESCETCYFMVRDIREGIGACHRYPPTIIANPGNYIERAGFPPIQSNRGMWCGEWKPKDEPEMITG